ncbi:alpha,alpha-trehalose-phosphate synthase [UDP-forming] 6-like protein [Tanacetum coccineum]
MLVFMMSIGYWGIGFGLSIRVVDSNFRKLSMEHEVSAYKQTATRAILLDNDDKNNMVFVVSAKSQTMLVEWFGECEKLGLAADRFLRLKRDEDGETCVQVDERGWKQNYQPVMTLYSETTDRSTIEDKETVLAYPDFGSCQAKELDSVLVNEPVTVEEGRVVHV